MQTLAKALPTPLCALGMGLAKKQGVRQAIPPGPHPMLKETLMQWSQPAFEDLRFGFEITMYISNR
ncbi:coenzyme PQQ precursor peptide PqqA [Variovorax soli]|uniref:Coenzyme PQQ synthesis protein A n=1 Tax=Variovorax soli TaxID=376815 RepID=A0ABU1NFE5_9BURK|nr:coenzyme PQQ precursor peptide PqqA [Variovorax soli]